MSSRNWLGKGDRCACVHTAKAGSSSHHEKHSIRKGGEKIISEQGFMDMALFKLVWE